MTPDETTEQAQPEEATGETPYLLHVTEETQNPEIEKRFSYHPPKGDQAARYERIRAWPKRLPISLIRPALTLARRAWPGHTWKMLFTAQMRLSRGMNEHPLLLRLRIY